MNSCRTRLVLGLVAWVGSGVIGCNDSRDAIPGLARSTSAITVTLTINTLGSGTVSASPAGPYASGTLVTLSASPASGWSFSSWSGNLTGYANPGTLIMNG